MRRLALEFLVAITLTIGAILALTPGVLANDVMVMGAFARASAMPTAKTGAIYMRLTNHGAVADRLLSVTTDAAEMAGIHESTVKDGVAAMGAVAALEIPAGATVEMKPGGYHIMLMGLKAPLKKGGMVMLQLTFEHAGKVEVMADVGDVAAEHAHGDGSTGN